MGEPVRGPWTTLAARPAPGRAPGGGRRAAHPVPLLQAEGSA
jgi:hypothetical protein